MIPKIIHYCWLSDDPFPDKIQYCIDSWKRVLHDYEIIKWDFKRFPKDKSLWVSEAFDMKKYAFAADYIRFYALYNYGGIYLDSDVEVLQKFDPFLANQYMFGRENSSKEIEAAVMGAEKNFEPFKLMLDYYEDKHFINKDGTYNCIPLPQIMKIILGKNYIYKDIASIDDFICEHNQLCLYPYFYFSPINLETLQLESTEDTVTIHHFAASWKSDSAIKRENSWWWKILIVPISKLSNHIERICGTPYAQIKRNVWTKHLR